LGDGAATPYTLAHAPGGGRAIDGAFVVRGWIRPRGELTEAQVQTGMRLLLADGVMSQCMAVLAGGAFLVALALELGASNRVIGLIAAIGPLTQVAQIPAIALIDWVRSRRALVVLPAVVGRGMFIGVAALPWLAPEGWRLGLDQGVTRRANTVLPNGPVADSDAVIDRVERRYRDHGLRPCFKMTAAAQPADLDRRLESRGYRAEGHSLVLVAAAGDVATAPSPHTEVTLHDQPTPAWLDTCWPASGERRALERIAARVPPPRVFGLARLAGIDAGAALAVAGRGWVGLTAVHTLPVHRRRGVAHSLLGALTGWAIAQGVPQLYLQVEADNDAARRLYAGLGFHEVYRYHYRRPAA